MTGLLTPAKRQNSNLIVVIVSLVAGALIGVLIMALSLHYFKKEQEKIQGKYKTHLIYQTFFIKADRIKSEIEMFEKTITKKELNATSTFRPSGNMSETL